MLLARGGGARLGAVLCLLLARLLDALGVELGLLLPGCLNTLLLCGLLPVRLDPLHCLLQIRGDRITAARQQLPIQQDELTLGEELVPVRVLRVEGLGGDAGPTSLSQ